MPTDEIDVLQLGKLLLELYHPDELAALLLSLPKGKALIDGLRTGAPAAVALAAAEAVVRHGLQAELYAALLRTRGERKRADIEAVFQRWHMAAPRGPEKPPSWSLPDPARRGDQELPRQAPPRTLGALLELQGDRVTATFEIPGQRTQPAPGDLTVPTLERLLGRDLASLLEALHREDSEHPHPRPLAPLTPISVGLALGSWLFGGEEQRAPIFRALFGERLGTLPGPLGGPVRLRLSLPEGPLARLPWTWLADAGEFLLDHGWTVERAIGDGGHVALPNPCSVLLVVPQQSQPELGAPRHLEELRGLFRRRWGEEVERRYVRVASSADELHHLDRRQVDLIYAYGHGRASPRGPLIELDGIGGRRPLPVAELAANAAPSAVYLNLLGAPGLWEGAALPAAPALLHVATASWPAHAARAGLTWLDALLQGADPVIAAHRTGAGSLSASAVLPGTAFSTWETGRGRAPETRNAARDYLDRHRQKADLYQQLSDRLMTVALRRVAAVVVLGDEHQLVHEFREQAVRHLRGERHATQPEPSRPPFRMEVVEPMIEGFQAQHLERALMDTLHHPEPTLRGRLEAQARRLLSSYAPLGAPMLLLDWGTVGDPSPDGRCPGLAFDDQDLGRWLRFASERLSPACPGGLRLVSFLSVRAPRDDHDAIREELREGIPRDAHGAPQVELIALDSLGEVPEDDVRHFLERRDLCSCSAEASPAAVAAALQARTGGRFDRLVQEIEQAEQTGWDALQREGAAILARREAERAAPRPSRTYGKR